MTDKANQATARLTDLIGPLPDYAPEFRPRWPEDSGGFTGAQMRLYVMQAVAAERERWAERVRSMCAADVRSGPGFYGEDDWIEAYKDLANMAGVECGYL